MGEISMRLFLQAFVVFMITIGIAYCTTKESTLAHSAITSNCGAIAKPVGSEILKKAPVERDTNSVIAESERSLVVAGNTAFAVDLYKKLTTENGNTFFSPYSVSCAFGITWGGARGQTEKEIAQILHFPLTQEKQHRSCLLYTSPSPRDGLLSRMPSSA